MSYPHHPHSQAPDPEDDRPGWYTARPGKSQQAQQSQGQRRTAPPPAHGYPPAHAHAHSHGYPAAAPDPAEKPYSPGLAGFGWVLTTVFGLAFILFFFAGVSAFNSTADGSDGASVVGAFIGYALILILPAIPILIGLRLIRQPKRIRPPR